MSRWFTVLLLLAVVATPATAIEGLDMGGGPPEVPIRAYVSHTGVAPGGHLQLAVVYQLPPDHHIQLNEFLFAAPGEGEPFSLGEPVLPPGKDWEGDPVFIGKVVVRYDLALSRSAELGDRDLRLIAGFQACSEKPIYACFAPEEKELTVAIRIVASGTPIQPQFSQYFRGARPPEAVGTPPEVVPIDGESEDEAWLEEAPAPDDAGDAVNTQEGLAEKLRGALAKGSWIAFLIVFIAGFLTSFTPCVYPMIPITIGFMVKTATGKLSGFILSLFFVLGIAIVYSTLGLAAALGGGVFGSALQSSAVGIVIAAVFAVMGISMLGAFDLTLPSGMQTKLQGNRRGGLVGALLMGGVTGIVASPCVGPVLVVLLTWVAQIGSPVYGFTLLFTFAFGLGLLFLLLGTFVGVVAAMPKAGAWMQSVKHYFGWVFLALAVYFLRTTIGPVLAMILYGVVQILFAAYIGALTPLAPDVGKWARFRKGIGVIFLILGILNLAGGIATQRGWFRMGGASLESTKTGVVSGLVWLDDEAEALARALEEGKPVLLDFPAEWGGACRELDEKAWVEPRGVEEVGRFILRRLEFTKRAPAHG